MMVDFLIWKVCTSVALPSWHTAKDKAYNVLVCHLLALKCVFAVCQSNVPVETAIVALNFIPSNNNCRGFCGVQQQMSHLQLFLMLDSESTQNFSKTLLFSFSNFQKTILINFVCFKFVLESKIMCVLQYLLGWLFAKNWIFSR